MLMKCYEDLKLLLLGLKKLSMDLFSSRIWQGPIDAYYTKNLVKPTSLLNGYKVE